MKVKRNVFLESSLHFIYLFFLPDIRKDNIEEIKQNDRQEVESILMGSHEA